MDPRRGDRTSQVRRRPPSTGRSATGRLRPVTPSPARLDGYRRIERRRGLPLPLRAFLAVSVILLGAAILWVSAGQVGPFIASVVKSVGGLVSQVGSTVSATPTPTPVPDAAAAPTIDALDSPYTNDETVDITINIPSAITGLAGYKVRLYDTLPDQQAKLVNEEPVGKTAIHIMRGVTLQSGRNDMQAAIFGPGGESERSEVATWILDQSKPRISVISPKDNAQVNRASVTIKGKSQAGAEIRLENTSNGAIATSVAGSDGLWETQLQVANGVNAINVTATDPAGNANTTELQLRRGSGKLKALLSASSYRFKASKLPRTITLTVTVTDPDGQRLEGATALFTVSVPGLEAIVSAETSTNRDGVATFRTTIPAGAMAGSGLATVLVTTDRDGKTTDRQVLTVVE